MEKDCIFCKIINKEIPSYKIYENEFVYAFLDVNALVKGHTLVIPKKHFVNLFDCEDKYLNEVIVAIKKIANHLKTKMNADGINVLQANNKAAGQSVFHLHFHIIPRFENDNKDHFPKGNVKYDLDQFSKDFKF